MTILLIALIVIASMFGVALLYQVIGVRRDARRLPPPGRMVPAGAHRLHVHEMGQGSPTVVLEAGISATCVNWRRVQTSIAEFTRVLSYDRAGLGWSDAARSPRTAAQIVEELHEMVRTADVTVPFILVGHSFGGLVARLYAMKYAGDVAGLVLVDPLRAEEWHPLTAERQRMLRGGAFLSRWGALLARFGVVRFTLARMAGGSRAFPRLIGRATSTGAGLATMERLVGEVRKMPKELWPAIMSHWSVPKSFASMGDHLARLPESVQCMIGSQPLQGVPVTMLAGAQSRMKWTPEEIARVSTDTTYIVAQNSGHWIQLDEPDVVVEAVREMVTRVREDARAPR